MVGRGLLADDRLGDRPGEEYEDDEYRDRVESSALLDLLETEIVPLFYRRGSDNTPGGWTELMRTAMIALCPVFNTNRMVQEYVVNGYAIADQRRTLLEHNGFQRARELAIWKDKIRKGWSCVDVARVEVSLPERTHVGEHLDVTAWIRPGGLALDDLAPQVFLGRLHEARDIVGPEITQMETRGLTDDNCALFHASIACQASGTHGLTVRILPRHPDLGHPHEMGLITWAR